MNCFYFFKSIKNNIIHRIYEIIYRTPNPLVVLRLILSSRSIEMKNAVNELHRDGVVILDSFIKDEQLQKLKKEFDDMIEAIEKDQPGPMKLSPKGGRLHSQVLYVEQGYDLKSKTTCSNNPFKYSENFLDLSLNGFILGVIEGYLGKKFMLQQATASRYYPLEKTNFGSWQWHHDSWGRKVNVMILFTDVTEKDQYMSFMKQSHKIYHSHERTTLNDRYTEEEVREQCGQSIVTCTGKAGTVFIFDANGFHRGNRSIGATRDTLINQYTAGRYLWGFDIPRKFTKELSSKKFKFLMQNPNIKLF